MARSLGFKPFIPCHKEHENLSHHREQMNEQIEKKRKEKKNVRLWYIALVGWKRQCPNPMKRGVPLSTVIIKACIWVYGDVGALVVCLTWVFFARCGLTISLNIFSPSHFDICLWSLKLIWMTWMNEWLLVRHDPWDMNTPIIRPCLRRQPTLPFSFLFFNASISFNF